MTDRLAIGLRRDLARVHAEIREADHAGRYRLALALTDEAWAIRDEIDAAEEFGVLALIADHMPMELMR